MVYEKIPIVDTAGWCGLVLDSRTLRRREVEATCPFCGDHGKGKYHLSLNTVTDQFRCNLCGVRGNSVSLYARLNGVSNKQAFQELRKGTNVYPICTNFLRGLDATKLSIAGHMYFVPKTYMVKVDIFEDFITLLGGLNRNNTPLMVNSFYIIDDEKQRGKMTEEFYAAVKKEITAYQERCDYLIQSGSQSPAVMDRWVLKVRGLEEKKKHYEQVLQRELDGLDDEFNTLKFLAQELQVRANSIRFQKAA